MNKQFLNEEGLQSVADNVNKRLKTVETMPVNPKSEQVVLYTGATSGDFVQGHIYEYNSETYYCYIAEDGGYYYHFYIKEIEAGATVYACGSPEWFQKKADSISELTSDFSEIGYTFSITAASHSSITVSNGGLSIVANRSSDDDLSNVGWTDITSSGTADQSFNPISSNAQSGVAVNEAKAVLFNKLFSKEWKSKTWNGLTSFNGSQTWTDGTDVYYSESTTQYVLNRETSTWETKTWNGLTEFYGSKIWTDGTDVYYSDYSNQYKLNKSTSTWESKTWNGFAPNDGTNVWHDSNNVYYSEFGTYQYVLNKNTNRWEEKTWEGFNDIVGDRVWKDGDTLYYSSNYNQWVFNRTSEEWEEKIWENQPDNMYGGSIWSDGNNIYFSDNAVRQYVLNRATSTWEEKTWKGYNNISGGNIWFDGTIIYYSSNTNQYELTTSLKTYID